MRPRCPVCLEDFQATGAPGAPVPIAFSCGAAMILIVYPVSHDVDVAQGHIICSQCTPRLSACPFRDETGTLDVRTTVSFTFETTALRATAAEVIQKQVGVLDVERLRLADEATKVGAQIGKMKKAVERQNTRIAKQRSYLENVHAEIREQEEQAQKLRLTCGREWTRVAELQSQLSEVRVSLSPQQRITRRLSAVTVKMLVIARATMDPLKILQDRLLLLIRWLHAKRLRAAANNSEIARETLSALQ
ncbi:hypothetical protein EVJ58_g3226 [Rhodofomes roseus]|uniref:Uncharacterized protein n=1 Tax=Rhodofomes roseus TaxID=34475 RepID=A0A4Y9YM32_9APHY|nr:hypothetical protein EVJ58_g3226 [Rhodofomes roseus]